MPITISGSGIVMQGTGVSITGAIGTVVVIPVDAYFPYVTLLLSGDGTNAAQNNTFTDSSTNNFSITRAGNTTQGTFTPYGTTWSNYFNGSTDYFTVPAQTALSFGTNDFTIECWIYLTSAPTTYGGVFDARPSSAAAAYAFGIYNTSGLKIDFLYSASRLTGSTIVSTNSWNHIAITRSGGTIRLFLNGVPDANTASYSSAIDAGRAAPLIGSVVDPYFFPGYISNMRIIKGTALYTTTFTPPTAPLTAIANTSLLTCQSNRFIDNSTSTFAITTTGTPSIQRFNPFGNGQSAYSTSVIGGSIYFTNTASYLSIPDNAALNMGASNFTIECWYYNTTAATSGTLFGKRATNAIYGGVAVNVASLQTLGLIVTVDGSSWGINVNSSIPVLTNTWNHVALVRNGNVYTLYINGVSGASATLAGTIPTNTAAFTVGATSAAAESAGALPNAYISNFRVVKGTAVYTTTFTPPTAPVTAITNTSLLLNFTNAGIYDSAAMNNVETVGTAQVNTSVTKYGTGSIYFAGAGQYMSMPASSGLNFGTSDFTIEMWVYFNSLANIPFLFQKMSGTTGWFIEVSASTIYFGWGSASGSQYIAFSASLSTGAWYHLAVTRTGSTVNAFVNGTSPGSQTLTSANLSYDNSVSATIGGFYAGTTTYDLNGYIDDFRITKGYVRYPSNFTAPTATLPTQ